MTVARLQGVADPKGRYVALMFCCPGCAATKEGYAGLHLLPVTGDSALRPTWTFNGDLESPTLTPSILTKFNWDKDGPEIICHSYLTNGVFNFLGDCTHPLVGQQVPIPELPTWADR